MIHKYRAQATTYNGIRYASKAEAQRAVDLDLLVEAGVVSWWHGQPGTFHLGCPENVYRPDFLVVEPAHETVRDTHVRAFDIHYEDVKGVETRKFMHDMKLWEAYGPCSLVILKRKQGGWVKTIIEGGG